jgi:hypothetical protein
MVMTSRFQKIQGNSRLVYDYQFLKKDSAPWSQQLCLPFIGKLCISYIYRDMGKEVRCALLHSILRMNTHYGTILPSAFEAVKDIHNSEYGNTNLVSIL